MCDFNKICKSPIWHRFTEPRLKILSPDTLQNLQIFDFAPIMQARHANAVVVVAVTAAVVVLDFQNSRVGQTRTVQHFVKLFAINHYHHHHHHQEYGIIQEIWMWHEFNAAR